MKQKRKAQPVNLKRYWIGFSLLAIFLLIPFRLMGNWALTNIIYLVIALVVAMYTVRFVWRYGLKQPIIILMIACVALPIFQMTINEHWILCRTTSEQGIIRSVSCSEGCDTEQHMIAIGNSPISIQTYFGRYFPYCLT